MPATFEPSLGFADVNGRRQSRIYKIYIKYFGLTKIANIPQTGILRMHYAKNSMPLILDIKLLWAVRFYSIYSRIYKAMNYAISGFTYICRLKLYLDVHRLGLSRANIANIIAIPWPTSSHECLSRYSQSCFIFIAHQLRHGDALFTSWRIFPLRGVAQSYAVTHAEAWNWSNKNCLRHHPKSSFPSMLSFSRVVCQFNIRLSDNCQFHGRSAWFNRTALPKTITELPNNLKLTNSVKWAIM